ncbi:hypothetical protein [Cohnella panacarvi]|uniref:hypothetical protein n=1 Tax=Cohnella panacarvi TaxID=400776 RepID=UPI00047D7667|nr:hypothetical protein [Cohnella panacarvi]
MTVFWKLPDGSQTENAVPDIEQLLLLLRLVNGVTLNGISYQVADAQLVVDDQKPHVCVSLQLKSDVH